MAPKKKGGKGGRGYTNTEYSGTQKKAQLQAKREKRRQKADASDSDDCEDQDAKPSFVGKGDDCAAPSVVTSFGGRCDAEEARLSSLFVREDDDVVAARRQRGTLPLEDLSIGTGNTKKAPMAAGYVIAEGNLPRCSRPSDAAGFLDHPVRPDWHEGMSASELEKREEEYFKRWSDGISERIAALGPLAKDVAPFELNLEVWRQLWRVVEQSDAVVLITDVRNPTFHIPPSLVHEVTRRHGLSLVIVLNKVDLVAHDFVQRWRRYLASVLPEVGVVEFSSRPADEPPGGERGAGTVGARRRWLGRRCRQADLDAHLDAAGKALLDVALCKQTREAATPKVDAEAVTVADAEAETQERTVNVAEAEVVPRAEAEAEAEEGVAGIAEVRDVSGGRPARPGKGPGGALAIGLVGHPNVGKTSVLNALAGRKAASVSGTAGHTRHLQHIRVQEQCHPCAYVIDCPGLVFPSLHSRAEAELSGLLPLAQVRETMSAVRILAEALPLPKMLGLTMPDWYEKDEPWSPMTICEAYAEKHKYLLPRSGAPDVHRAGLEIMKDGKDGAMLLAYEPPTLQ